MGVVSEKSYLHEHINLGTIRRPQILLVVVLLFFVMYKEIKVKCRGVNRQRTVMQLVYDECACSTIYCEQNLFALFLFVGLLMKKLFEQTYKFRDNT